MLKRFRTLFLISLASQSIYTCYSQKLCTTNDSVVMACFQC